MQRYFISSSPWQQYLVDLPWYWHIPQYGCSAHLETSLVNDYANSLLFHSGGISFNGRINPSCVRMYSFLATSVHSETIFLIVSLFCSYGVFLEYLMRISVWIFVYFHWVSFSNVKLVHLFFPLIFMVFCSAVFSLDIKCFTCFCSCPICICNCNLSSWPSESLNTQKQNSFFSFIHV